MAADKVAANVLPIVRDIQAAGHTTLREIAESLNAVACARRAAAAGVRLPFATCLSNAEKLNGLRPAKRSKYQ